jgi:hypothetical protein
MGMTEPELEKELKELQDLLEEVEEEREIILGQENLHISSKLVIKYEKELAEIGEDIALVESRLKEIRKA